VSAIAAAAPLAGVRVVDLSNTLMGPYCSLLLARMGADVIKVEPPAGDVTRDIGGGRHPKMGPIFLGVNHGKRSLALDLKSARGRQALLRVIDGADVFLTNMRPRALEQLGLGYGDLGPGHPRLVHCRLLGFGMDGPYRDFAAYDDAIQAISGLAAVQGNGGAPEYVRTTTADKTVALFGLSAILAALFARERTGRGQAVEVPMFEAMAAFLLAEQQGGYVFDPPAGPPGYARTASPYRRPYATADGNLSVVIYTDRMWEAFFALIGRPELGDDPRFSTLTDRTAHIDELYKLVEDSLPARTTDDWSKALAAAGIPAVPVLGLADLFDDPHLEAVGFFDEIDHPSEGRMMLPRLPVRFGGAAAPAGRPAPRLGEHSTEVLREAGLDPREIAALVADGVVREAETAPG
jgi:crotonobetainyl-CoA:carnitine CoA-transferase CaiB-like acyl-CoA transferase